MDTSAVMKSDAYYHGCTLQYNMELYVLSGVMYCIVLHTVQCSEVYHESMCTDRCYVM